MQEARRKTRRFLSVNDETDYTPDELEFMRAMDAYKRNKMRPFPGWSEVLSVAWSLGYRKLDGIAVKICPRCGSSVTDESTKSPV